jgi:hypothetical protein
MQRVVKAAHCDEVKTSVDGSDAVAELHGVGLSEVFGGGLHLNKIL